MYKLAGGSLNSTTDFLTLLNRLFVYLHPSINYLPAGGKSAILMALVIGLGGKSSATNRAPNMTEFIKQGSSWGQVTITLSNSNHNHDAWEYDVSWSFQILYLN